MTQSIVNEKTMARVDSYMNRPYTQRVVYDPRDKVWVARVEELEGCSAHGESAEEAISKLQDTMKDWLLDAIEDGDDIPLPKVEEPLPSGKWVQRVPRSLHLRLVKLAKQEDTSLNQFVLSVLAEAVGREKVHPSASHHVVSPIHPTVAGLYGAIESATQQVYLPGGRCVEHTVCFANDVLLEERLATLAAPPTGANRVLRFRNGGIAISAEADNQVRAYQA